MLSEQSLAEIQVIIAWINSSLATSGESPAPCTLGWNAESPSTVATYLASSFSTLAVSIRRCNRAPRFERGSF